MNLADKTLVIVTGPTASGKTELAIELAEALSTEIISADSRQMYRGIEITTAAPTLEEMARVRHHFVGTIALDEYYSAARFADDADKLLYTLWNTHDYVVMCGGSMLYIDAVVRGVDNLPTVSDDIRRSILRLYQTVGLDATVTRLLELDPAAADRVDLRNPRRVVHALELTLQAGRPYTSMLTGKVRKLPYRVVTLSIDWPRDELFSRINSRVNAMVAAGMEEEARRVYPLRHLNSLNTVGLKEWFAVFDGLMDRDTAIARIAKNTRVYAKKQLTWLRRPDRQQPFLLDPHRPLLPQAIEALSRRVCQ